MAQKKIKTRIKLLKNTDAYFLAKNPITVNGELYIVEIGDGVKFKIGNGSAYADLNFYEDDLLQTLGFDLKDVQHGQILMYNSASQK